MISLPFAQNKTYYVVGLGKSNAAVIKSLVKSGADVRIWDDNEERRAAFDGTLLCLPEKAPWLKIKAVVMAPGIPPSHPVVQQAVEKNIPVICDIDLFAQSEPTSKVIGITGTNGKSTVTALIHHILNAKGKAQKGGNIGTPVLELKPKMDYTVLELSSYQLERSPHLTCDVAVLLNITKDHMEWHETMENYVAAKEVIFANARVKILSIDDDFCKDIYSRHEDAITFSVFGDDLPVTQTDVPKLKGLHNLQNMLAAYEACRALGVDHDMIIDRMKSFEGLAHRQYMVRVINGIPYINDSKATNAEASRAAIRAFRNIIWILGGQPKEGGLNPLADELGNVQNAFVYGEAAEDFARFLSVRGVPVEVLETLDEALTMAHKTAQDMRGEPSGAPVVLLSPACASFDQYKNFEERGDHFVKLVEGLSDE
tara:strand:- start:66 stop:1346 length:1281 start_codon:yes stop_codon:yes gene_type:complete